MVLAGLHLGSVLTEDLHLRSHLRRLAARLEPGVTSVLLDGTRLRKVRRELTHLTASYEPIVKLVELLRAGIGITLESEPHQIALSGFLFDMNLFFESLLGRFLRENLIEYSVLAQHRLRGIMMYAPNANPRRRRAPTPRPDFAIESKGKLLALVDTKYRDLWSMSLPRDMLYQVAIYALGRTEPRQAIILYPTIVPEAQDQVIVISEPIHGANRATVVLLPVNMRELAELLQMTGREGEHFRHIMALKYISGSPV